MKLARDMCMPILDGEIAVAFVCQLQ